MLIIADSVCRRYQRRSCCPMEHPTDSQGTGICIKGVDLYFIYFFGGKPTLEKFNLE